MFGLSLEQAERLELWEFELYYEAYYKRQIQQTRDHAELAFIENMARATDKSGKYQYDTLPSVYKALGVEKSEERIKRMFYPDEFYEENKEEIDDLEQRKIAQQRLNEYMSRHK